MNFFFKRRKRRRQKEATLPEKANRILNGILIALLLITFRVWHLAVIQHDAKLQEAVKPQKRVVITRAERATIQDREGTPLAVNKVQYNAAVLYSRIREIPRFVWKKDDKGRRYKIFKRLDYIKSLSSLLADELNLNKERIEDLIHAKASIFGSVPLMVKEDIGEEAYFRLKMLEKDWPGILAEISSRRCYPLGPVAAEVIGYTGVISQSEYERITKELKLLSQSLSMWEEGEQHPLPPGFSTIAEVEARLRELEKKAYHINDKIGKIGVEGAFEEELRGARGKKAFLADPRGNFLTELPGGDETLPGSKLKLTINASLQEYGEQLLGEFERKKVPPMDGILLPENQPWIKGGAIVVMDPHSGDILAMSSYPRYDPNDFSNREAKVHKWLEDEKYIAAIWDQKEMLDKEVFLLSTGKFQKLEKVLSWDFFLSLVLDGDSPVAQKLDFFKTVKDAALLDKLVQELLSFFPLASAEKPLFTMKVFNFLYPPEKGALRITLQEKEELERCAGSHNEEIETLKDRLYPFFSGLTSNFEKILLIDLCRLVVDSSRFSPLLLELIGDQELGEYKKAAASFAFNIDIVCTFALDWFKANKFDAWRKECFDHYLVQKRKEEKKEKKWAHPYVEYLDEAFRMQFAEFWEEKKWEMLALFLVGDGPFLDKEAVLKEDLLKQRQKGTGDAALEEILTLFDGSLIIPYLKTLRTFDDLTRPLLGKYARLRTHLGRQLEKDLAASFYPTYGYGYSRSFAFRTAATIGSIFKLVPAYVALCQQYEAAKALGKPLNLNPLTIVDDKRKDAGAHGGWSVGKTLDGHSIPMYYKGGRLPRSDHSGIGRVDLLGALEASSNPYFSILAGEVIEDPEDFIKAAESFGFGSKTGIDLPGEYKGVVPSDVVYDRTGLYSLAIGQHSLAGTPLQVAVMLSAIGNGGFILKPKIVLEKETAEGIVSTPTEIVRKVYLPSHIRNLLLKGMQQVVLGDRGTARSVRSMPLFKSDGLDLVHTVVGKTSTAEIMDQMNLEHVYKVKDVWFGAISFDPDASLLPGEELLYKGEFGKPDLVVVVYLRLGSYGNEGAPIAFKMIKKWKELQRS